MRASKVWDGTDPGATPGRVFTASIPQETIIPEGVELTHMKLALKGAISSAAVAVESFAGVLSEYVLRVGAENRIILNLRDMIALQAFYFKTLPTIGENTDNTGNDFIGGVTLPVFAKVEQNKPLSHSAARTAVTNVGTETLAATAYFEDKPTGKKPIHAVAVPYTTAAATGYDTPAFRIAPVGTLIGLIIQQANHFADGNIDVSVQRVRLLADGQVHSQFNALTDHTTIAAVDHVTPSPMGDLLRDYSIFDLRESGIDAKAQELTLQLDVEDASDAIRIIPVMELAA